MIPHKKYMQMAISLAKKGKGKVEPNPMVGCIIVKRGQIVGQGYHKKFGGPHAEIEALEQASHKAKDSILYVTLEPCSHWGKTPPCTDSIVEAGVREVVIGMEDPNPKVQGYEILKQRGLKVRMGILEEECKKINIGYIKYKKKKMPHVVLKAGMTLDGKIATQSGKSKYITGPESLKHVHKMRSEMGVVMIGINSVLKDNPKLDARKVKGKDPIKLIIDTSLKITPKAKVLKNPELVIIACSDKASKTKMKKLEEQGVTFITTKTKNKVVDIKKVLKEMAKMGHMEILSEGGALINASLIKDRLADELMLFTSPKIMGDDGKGFVGPLGVKELNKAVKLKDIKTKPSGKDILIRAKC